MKLVKHEEPKSRPLPVVSRGWNPFWPMRHWESELDRWFMEPFGSWQGPETFFEAWGPAVNVYEEKNNVMVQAELPGMKKEEIKVYLTGENLNLTGERKAENEEKTAELYRSERYFGRFHRSIPLPSPVDARKMEAHYKDGILTITCPKSDAAKRKEVEIKVE